MDLQPLACWDCGVRILPRSWVCVSYKYCQVEIFATSRSLVQRSPIECVLSVFSETSAKDFAPTKNQSTSKTRYLRPLLQDMYGSYSTGALLTLAATTPLTERFSIHLLTPCTYLRLFSTSLAQIIFDLSCRLLPPRLSMKIIFTSLIYSLYFCHSKQ
jgi:hypothetical protein